VHAHNVHSVADLDALIATLGAEADAGLARHLLAVRDTDPAALLAAAIADLPLDLRCLIASGAVTVEQLWDLHKHFNVTTAADLLAVLRRRAVRTVPGLDGAVRTAIAKALPTMRATVPRIPLGRAVNITEPILARLRAAAGVAWAEPVGSLRRGDDMVGDLEIVAPSVNPQPIFDQLAALAERQFHRSQRRLYLSFDGVQVGIRSPSPACGGAVLLNLTGSPRHIDRLTDLAAERGWRLDADALRRNDGSRIVSETEEDIYAALELPFIAPEIRDGGDEFDAAATGRLPNLVTVPDIRGDLHLHTNWSDGHDSLEAMVAASAALGYDYIAITDHSEHSAASRSLTRDDVARQAEAIAAVRERYPQLVVLHGCEVDIMANGSLDFPDALLQQFDIVLASLHDRGRHGPRELMQRYARAMRHPLVSIITHPTNRVVPRRAGYDLDWDQVIADAIETGTVLEVDGAPSHLDMPGPLARRAMTLGASIVIDSDCHRADLLGRQMELGVRTARRGWVEARQVINTRPIEAIRALVAAKRSR
jgi:DNA polymerase (family 10)